MHYKTFFISDIHIGSAGCHAAELLSFLKSNTADTIYLVGDIFDIWVMRNGIRWNRETTALIQHLLKLSRKGIKIIYIPGNHDEVVRELIGSKFDTIEIKMDDQYIGLNGKRYYITHGDQFDEVVKMHPFISKLGAILYNMIVKFNFWINKIRRSLGIKKYWSFSAAIKKRVKDAAMYIGNFENVLISEAKRNNFDGVICGHIHAPCVKQIDGLDYINCGDIVENLTIAAEDNNGNIINIKLT
jgi:UDP-2,3-diacylglucosamine pyrophosphatase LpxH